MYFLGTRTVLSNRSTTAVDRSQARAGEIIKAVRGVVNLLLSLVWEARLVGRRMFVTLSNYKSFLYGVSNFFPPFPGRITEHVLRIELRSRCDFSGDVSVSSDNLI
jgi:hypothetical protein